jgi:hypothetical protein
MKLRRELILALCIGLVCSVAGTETYAQGGKITVYNPMGAPPPIKMKSMAPRLDTIDGKTIYLVSTGFPNSREFMEVMQEWFADNHPKVTTVIRTMGMSNMPRNLKEEISQKADAVFFGLGH